MNNNKELNNISKLNDDNLKQSEVSLEAMDISIIPKYEEVIDNFENMGLKLELLKGIYSYGFEFPQPVQQKAITAIIQRKDVIVQAQSGVGKTHSYVIGSLQLVDTLLNQVQILVLGPTRELAYNIAPVYNLIGGFLNVKICTIVGGISIKDTINNLVSGVHIAIATPGRVLDMLYKNYLKLTYLKIIILEEADEMVFRGFSDSIKNILSYIPPECQVCVFSSSDPKDIIALTTHFMNNPVNISLKKEQLTLSG